MRLPDTPSLEDLLAAIDRDEIDTVVVATPDMQGRLVGKRATGRYFADHMAAHGTHICTYLLGTDIELNTPDGFESMNWHSGYGDFQIEPDWQTLRFLPWHEKTALVLADPLIEASGDPVPISPRQILRKQIDRLVAVGLAPMMATELEFYLFRDSFEEARRGGYADLERFGWYSEDYQLFQAGKAEPLYRLFRNQMLAARVPIEYSKGEAAPGQHEINIHYSTALEAADRAVLFKHGAKEIASQFGCAITFMAKPDQHWTGSSGHIHVSLWDLEENQFGFQTPNGEMSDTMRWFLGGMISHAREFALFFAPNINSYKRFAKSSWAPTGLAWGRDNRTCGFRVVGSGNGLRIENRIPGSDVNPYLAFAATLAAGLQGIEGQIEPPVQYAGNAYLDTEIERIPGTLRDALQFWNQSDAVRQAFGEVVQRHYANAARVELDAFDQAVTDWERIRYFERI